MLTLDPIWQADTQQAQFRRLLEAMSYPGRCFTLHNIKQDTNIALAVLATLTDSKVSVADPHSLLTNDDYRLLQIIPMIPDEADFIVCDASQVPDFSPKLGSLTCPEHSATLILVVNELGRGDTRLKFKGPGIKNENALNVDGLSHEWFRHRTEWNDAFPLGVDWIIVDKRQLVALPRTTQVEVM